MWSQYIMFALLTVVNAFAIDFQDDDGSGFDTESPMTTYQTTSTTSHYSYNGLNNWSINRGRKLGYDGRVALGILLTVLTLIIILGCYGKDRW